MTNESLWHGNITRHFKRAHENIKAYECEACDRAFTVKIALQRHQYTVHGIKNLPLFKCSKCEFETIHRVVLKNHIIGNHETIPKKCELCQKVLKNIICFRNHMRIVHSENKKVYKCEVCPKQYDKLKK